MHVAILPNVMYWFSYRVSIGKGLCNQARSSAENLDSIARLEDALDNKHTWQNSIMRFPWASNPICTSSSRIRGNLFEDYPDGIYRGIYLYQILKFLDCTGLPSGMPNNPRWSPTTWLRFVWTTDIIACNLPRCGRIIEI